MQTEHIQREIEDERRSPPKRISHFTGVGSLGCWGVPPQGLGTCERCDFFSVGNRPAHVVIVHTNYDKLMQGLNEPFARELPTGATRTVATSKVSKLREREIEWRRMHPEVFRQFENKWVALEGQEIIAHGEDAADVIKAARAQGIKKPYVFFVESKDENVVVYGL